MQRRNKAKRTNGASSEGEANDNRSISSLFLKQILRQTIYEHMQVINTAALFIWLQKAVSKIATRYYIPRPHEAWRI